MPHHAQRKWANDPENQARSGRTNVALTIMGKGGAFQSDAFRSAEHVVRDAQSSDLA